MKKADMRVGEVVRIPLYQFAPLRRGWNGWIFTVGIVKKVYRTKSGKIAATVEFPTRGYAQELKNMRGEVVRIGDRSICEKAFYETAVFKYESADMDQKMVNDYKREELCRHTYTEETEFLIDRGILTDNK